MLEFALYTLYWGIVFWFGWITGVRWVKAMYVQNLRSLEQDLRRIQAEALARREEAARSAAPPENHGQDARATLARRN